jgi:uncharacterized protein YjiS (DUF1127 family)
VITPTLFLLFHQRVIRAFRDWRHRAARRRRIRIDASQLVGMSERDLCDLGIGRSEVPGLLQMNERRSWKSSYRGRSRSADHPD